MRAVLFCALLKDRYFPTNYSSGASHRVAHNQFQPRQSRANAPQLQDAPGVGDDRLHARRLQSVFQCLDAEQQRHVYYYAVLPNLLLSLHPDYVMSHILWPRSCNRTEIWCEWHFHPSEFDHPAFDPADAIDFWDDTNREDWRVSELSQLGISSRGYAPGPYSPRESIPAAWDRYYLRFIN